VEHIDERLDVVHYGRLSEEADLDRERRLVARLPALPLDRLEDRCLLAADVRPGAAPDLDVEREILAHHVPTEEPASAGLRERMLERVQRLRVLPPEVEVAPLAPGGVGGDGHRLDHRERIALHQLAVLERARLGLVRVADEVVRACGLPCDRLPLDPGRERGTAATDQLGVLHLPQHALGAELERAAEGGIAPVRAVVVDTRSVGDGPGSPPARRSSTTAAVTGACALSSGSSPATETSAAGARSHWPRHGLRCHVAEPSSESSPSGPKRSSSCAIRSCEPWQRHATSSQTWTTRGGRGSSAKSA